VLVPLNLRVAVGHLNEADTGLQEAPGQQALTPEGRSDRIIHPVQLQRLGSLSREILDYRHLPLHPEGQLERLDPAFQRLIWARLLQVLAVHLRERVQLQALNIRRGSSFAVDVLDLRPVRGDGGVADGRTGASSWQERRAPVIDPAVAEGRADGDEPGQVPVLGPEAVGDPRAHTGPDEVVAAGVELEAGRPRAPGWCRRRNSGRKDRQRAARRGGRAR